MLVTRHHSGWVTPFGHPRITARLTTPRGLSQPPTSFIGPWCPGIHHVPYITWPQRCSHPLYNSQTTTQDNTPTPRRPVPSDTQQRTISPTPPRRQTDQCVPQTIKQPTTHEHTPCQLRTLQPPHPQPHRPQARWRATLLLRKEVIQPHLPVRLPCYDFVPIASPTFDHSPRKPVGPWASGVTDFHDVTGGVYKARERIHRSTADLRLLATPTSRGRVADPDPN